MTYELAKKLKDAGFPDSEYWREIDGNYYHDADRWPCPSLSELIEACGEVNFNLNAMAMRGKNNTWYAGVEDKDYREVARGNGKTPEEAVANLYLELNSPLDKAS